MWARIGLGVGTGLVVVGLVWAVVLPSVAKGRVEQALVDRLGMQASVGRVWLGLGSASLRSVELEGEAAAVRVKLSRAKVSVGLRALLGGRVSVSQVEADDAQVDVDLRVPGAEASVDGIREALGGSSDGGDGGDASATTAGVDRRVRVEGLQVRVHGPKETGLTIRDGSVHVDGGQARLEASDMNVRSRAGHQADLVDGVVGLARSEEGWRVTRLTASRGEVSLQQWESTDPSGDEEDAPAGSPDATSSEADGATASADQDEDDDESGPEGSEDDGAGAGWAARFGDAFARLDPEVEVRVSDLTILSRGPEGTEPVLTGLSFSLLGDEPGAFRSSGHGQAAGEGDLEWEVMLRPREARAEGVLRFQRLPLALVAPLLPALPWHQPERAYLEGDLEVRAESPSRMAVEGRVTLADAALMSPRIAPGPVRDISLTLEGEGFWIPEQRRLVLETGSVRTGPAAVHAEGTLEWSGEHYLVAASIVLPPTACDDAVGAVPVDLLGDVASFTWSGEMAGKLVVHVDSRNLDDTELDIRLANGCRFVTVPTVADLQRFRDVFVHEVQEPDDTVFEMTTGPGSGNWQPIRSVSPFLVHAVLAHEDAAFFRHQGFAPWAIEEALKRNLKAGSYVVGASTITMQLAKNLFLRREKTLARKVQEVLLTWWLERSLDKREILELYLNVIEYGPEVYGIRNAALHYFGRAPSELSASESAYLATVLPNPKRHADEHESGTLRPSTAAKMKRLLRHMVAKERIDEEALQHAMADIDSFEFHDPNEPPPPPEEAPGEAGPLPTGVADEAEGSGWSGWDAVFEGREATGMTGDDAFQALPEVDPDAMGWD